MKLNQLLIALILGFFANASMAQTAEDLLIKMDELMAKPKDREATVQIILINKSGKEKAREALMLQKGKDMKLYQYTQPESQAGIATLSLPDGIMWLYMPAFGKATKISLLSKSQAFSGTDFSYEDMNYTTYSERYEASMLDGSHPDYYLLKLSPRSQESKYDYLELYMNKTHHYPIKIDFYNSRDQKFKEAKYIYTQKENYWYAEEVLMTDLKKKHSTKIIMSDIKFDQGLQDALFTVENLKKIGAEAKEQKAKE